MKKSDIKNFFKAKKYIFIIIFSFVLIVVGIIKTSYAAVTYTRVQLQNSVVATAVTYLYNNEYSDYSQKQMDNGSGYYNVNVYWKNNAPTYTENGDKINNWNITYPFRTFTQSPDSASRTNRFFIDCSSFSMSTYINALGIDLSDLAMKTEYPTQDFGFTTYYTNTYDTSITSPSSAVCTSAPNSLDCDKVRVQRYKNSYLYYNTRVLGTSIMNNVIKSIKNGSPSMNTTYSVNKNASSIKNKYVVYFREVENATSSQQETIKNDMNAILKPGDLIIRRRTASDGSENGHVVVYVGNKLGDTHGIIEARGTDMYRASNYGKTGLASNDKTHATGKDAYSIRYTSHYKYMTDISPSDMKIAIIRPLNAFCTNSGKGNQDDANDEVCTVPDSSSLTFPDAQESIKKARLRFRFQKIRREQYAMSGAYRSDGTTTDGKLLGKYNSVTPGDKIT